ncbi:esterase family protein [Nakamurella sp. PAMC28650]|uniref:alpha/beta hydrolase n=1 Tax=Nakamurella sp. PAMC28650 TaxID=2762325 RepID=UPI00164EBBC8|nr:alpha/beta hydrolase-fold protein [Nakamurella sp. PAMC28650]QNK79602.1 esterase [Nakamurella sp. PAMC28650]
MIGTTIDSQGVDFEMPHRPGVTGIGLEVDWSLGTASTEFVRTGDRWRLHLPRPAVDRMEYQLSVRSADGTSWVTDPGNPDRVANPFGDKSEIRFPEYVPPQWLTTEIVGRTIHIATPAMRLAAPVPVTLWTPPDLDPATPAPLLLAHDGSDMATRGALLRWASAAVARRPFRVALLDPAPGLRNDWYAASTTYADHLAAVLLPAIGQQVAIGHTVGLGASLGALSMLLAAHRHPALLDALALQSGSYFTTALDAQESGFEFFARICAVVSDLADSSAGTGGRVLITCGAVEENLANNEMMAAALSRQGFRVQLHLVRDAHTMIGWRDAWSPGLEQLLRTRP